MPSSTTHTRPDVTARNLAQSPEKLQQMGERGRRTQRVQRAMRALESLPPLTANQKNELVARVAVLETETEIQTRAG